ncbi:MAG: PKD domain-containing protein, partial [Flavobacteriales bacterium]|nr:PKD domain-containing protein [Flavobacteriales bacterium]
MKKIFALLFLVTGALASQAQEHCFGGEPEFEACGGFLTDSGCSASDYSPNENSVVTICNDGTGEESYVNLYWSFFDLGTGDQLEIYDGPDTGSPLIGTYVGNELQAQNITSTGSCITLLFTSNSDSDVGSFGAEISCEAPCIKPFAIATTDETELNPMKLCVGEEVAFDGSTSILAEGVSLASFTWDFDDGTTNTTDWPAVTHSFANPGVYKVQLFLTDDTECSSANLTDILIFVSTTPEMVAVADDYEVCIGQEVTITGQATPVTFDPQPDVNFGDGLFIPDDQTQCFSSELTFSSFNPGETIDEVSDIEFFFINFEHSFMGDIVITFICPDGSSQAVHQQGGGGTWLGEPVDDESLTPGVGYDYYWAPDATNGTWAENGFGGTLPAGTYESVQPFTNMIGCPLNGTWTVEVCDMWAVDNGFIFDWSIQFNEELYPELISFTPSIGAGIDSTFWEGSYFTPGGLGDVYTFTIPDEGEFEYVYYAIDDFGCTYSDTISILSYPGPIPDAGEEMPFCDEAQLQGVVTNPVEGMVYQYNWSPGAPLSNSNISDPVVEDIDEDTWFYFTVNPAQDPKCAVTDSVWWFIPEPPAE